MKKAILKTSGMLLVVGLAFTAMLFGCRHKAEPKSKAEPKTESVDPAIFKTDGNGKITGYNCPKDKLPKNLVIPTKIGDEIIASIGISAFRDCTGLMSVSFPASLTWIYPRAFDGCTGLTSVDLSSCTSLTSIRWYAFRSCRGLTSVSFPASLTSIGGYAFDDCSGLTSVSFPASLTEIGSSAFRGCSGLTSVSFPASLTEIGSSAFSGCSSLTSVTVDVGNSTYKAVDNVVYTKDGKKLVFAAGDLTSVNILPSVTSIGDSAFCACAGLTSVSFPASLTSIGSSAFSGCKGLTSVSFPASLTSIGNYAFSDCTGLTSVSFPVSLTSIGWYAFKGCSSLTSATFADAVGWAVYDDDEYKNKAIDIKQSDLENAATAAKYLREIIYRGGYCGEYWKKN